MSAPVGSLDAKNPPLITEVGSGEVSNLLLTVHPFILAEAQSLPKTAELASSGKDHRLVGFSASAMLKAATSTTQNP
jgi:hypothetical protein